MENQNLESEVSHSKLIFDFMKEWKIATSKQIMTNLYSNRYISKVNFRAILSRMRTRGLITTMNVFGENLHFEFGQYRRFRYMESLPPAGKLDYMRKMGVEHHIDVGNLTTHLRKTFPDYSFLPNFNPDHFIQSYGSRRDRIEIATPDIAVNLWPHSTDRYGFIEYERSLKGEDLYFRKWTIYECDPNVSWVLYQVTRPEIHRSLERKLQRFYQGTTIARDFVIGLFKEESLESVSPDTEIQIFGAGVCEKVNLGLFLSKLRTTEN